MKKILIILAFLFPFSTFSQIISKEKLNVLVQDYAEVSQFTGIVQVSQNGKSLFEKAYGYADRETKKGINNATRFNIASGGKSFTAALIMQLVERGKIDLHKPIQPYLPNYLVPNGDKITIHHLLTHTSGLSDYMLTPGYFDKKIICKSIDEVMELVIKMPLDFSTPGLRYRYSNSGYIVLGKILENIYNEPYGEILNEQILKPLGINDLSLVFPAKYGQDNIAKPYYVVSSTRAVEAIENELPPFSDGGFITSSPSLIKFFEGLYSGKLVSKATLQLMAQNYLKEEYRITYGYGFDVKSFAGIEGRSIGLSGGGAGFTTYVEMNIANGLVIAVCANSKFKSEVMTDAIRNLLYQDTYQKPKLWVVPWLVDRIEAKEELVPNLRQYVLNNYGRDFNDPRYFIEAAELMQLGGMIGESEMLLVAITNAYNNNSYVYSALGNFYFRQGNKEGAQANFEKSLKLDSSNPFAKNGMAQIQAFDNHATDYKILPSNKKAKLDSLFAIIDKNDKGMGGVSIFQDGKEIYSSHYGFLSMYDSIKTTKETKYRIGSMTKMFTAVIILKQVEDKKLSLNTKLNVFFPEIKNADKITIEMLLKHRSGIANFTDLPQYPEWQASTLSEQDWVAKILSIPSNFGPNEKFEYSNTNFLLLSLIAQKIDKLAFEDLLKKYITVPSRMNNTFISKRIDVRNSEALSYIRMVNWELSPETNPMLTLGAGAITSTAYDVNLFFTQLFEGKIISKNSLQIISVFQDGHSLGFQEFLYEDLRGIGHGGKVDGFNCYGSYFPDKKISVVFTSNATLYPMYEIWIGIMNILFDYPYGLPVFKAMDSKDLEKYEGIYANENFPFKFHVKVENKMLVMEGDGQKFALENDKENTFKLDMIGLFLEFLPSEGKMFFKQSDGVFEFRKE